MSISYEPRGTGWRSRGRPPVQVDPRLVAILRPLVGSGSQARLPLRGADQAEVRRTVAALRRAAASISPDLTVRWQRTADDHLIFYVEEK